MVTPYTVELDEARPAFLAELDTFLGAARSLDDLDLLGASRAHGWSRMDCLVHVRMGLQEMLAGIPAVTAAPPDVDAATYWSTWEADDDPVPSILMIRRTASAYTRPTHVVEHLREVSDGLRCIVPTLAPGSVRFQGHVITVGDLLATWAVEVLVHRWDLDVPGGMALGERSSSAARIGRRTVEALASPDPTDGGQAHASEPFSGNTEAADDLTTLLRGFGRDAAQ